MGEVRNRRGEKTGGAMAEKKKRGKEHAPIQKSLKQERDALLVFS